MKTIYKYFFVLITLNFLTPSFAWNYTGHVLIAQIAYDNLTPGAKQQANQLANAIHCGGDLLCVE